MAWFGPKGVASMLFALFVLKSQVGERRADLRRSPRSTIIASIVAHGLTDTVGARMDGGRRTRADRILAR